MQFEFFDERIISFLDGISKSIIGSKIAQEYPSLITFAFFIRKRNLLSIKPLYHVKKIPIGTVLHITPNNIPINSGFSLLFSLLCGNKNIVKLPSRKFEELDLLKEIFESALREDPVLTDYIRFVQLERGDSELDVLLENSQAVMVWGSNETVRHFKGKAHELDIEIVSFPNKFSSSVINANSEFDQRFFELFHNDTVLMHQFACSSSTNLHFLGKRERISDFFDAFLEYLKAKDYERLPILNIDRIVSISKLLSVDDIDLKNFENYFYTVSSGDFSKFYGNNTFNVFHHEEVNGINKLIRPNEQTITYYGVDKDVIFNSLFAHNVYVNRIVPVGQALAINYNWDGLNILDRLTRETVLL